MKTLAIISHKGGAGKTSSAVMLAEDFARRGVRVVLVDADRHKGASLMLGIEQPSGTLQQTRDPKLRYLCSSGLPLKELPAKSQELAAQFDLAVVDTPSLDDPLAKGWIQLSTDILVVIPVEPISVRTMDSADNALDNISRMNPQIRVLGILPTMFDESDATQRSLMLELKSLREDELLAQIIPLDHGMVHRAEQKAEKRTEPSQTTRQAYHAAGDFLMPMLGLKAAPVPAAVPAAGPAVQAPAAAAQPAPSQTQVLRQPSAVPPTPVRSGPSPLRWVVAVMVVLALAALGWWQFMGPGKASASGKKQTAAAVPAPASKGAR
jgi:cellulose biosynthesis protein BcsQ